MFSYAPRIYSVVLAAMHRWCRQKRLLAFVAVCVATVSLCGAINVPNALYVATPFPCQLPRTCAAAGDRVQCDRVRCRWGVHFQNSGCTVPLGGALILLQHPGAPASLGISSLFVLGSAWRLCGHRAQCPCRLPGSRRHLDTGLTVLTPFTNSLTTVGRSLPLLWHLCCRVVAMLRTDPTTMSPLPRYFSRASTWRSA